MSSCFTLTKWQFLCFVWTLCNFDWEHTEEQTDELAPLVVGLRLFVVVTDVDVDDENKKDGDDEDDDIDGGDDDDDDGDADKKVNDAGEDGNISFASVVWMFCLMGIVVEFNCGLGNTKAISPVGNVLGINCTPTLP